MKIQNLSIVFLALLGILVANALAQNTVPTMINYQGFLTDTTGGALDGTYMLTFRLFEEPTGAASIRWEEVHSDVKVVNGLFNVLLGSLDTLTAEDLAGDRYLEIRVNDEVEMTPRMRLASSAYALQADKMEPDFDSGWFPVTIATTYPLPLGFTLTDLPMSVQIYWSDNDSPVMGSDQIWLVQAGQYYYNNSGMNAYVEIYDASTIKIHTGAGYTFYAWRAGSETTVYSQAGYYKVRLWK